MGKRMTRAEVAESWGVARQQVDKAIEAGVLVEENATIDPDHAAEVRASMDIDKRQRAGAAKDLADKKGPDPIARTFNMARAQEQVLKSRQRKLKLEIEEGKWVDRDLVVQQCAAAGKMLAHRLQNACKMLAPQVVTITNPQEAVDLLERTLVDGVLAEFRKELSVEHDAERADQEEPE